MAVAAALFIGLYRYRLPDFTIHDPSAWPVLLFLGLFVFWLGNEPS